MPATLYEKIFNRHIVREDSDTFLIYIDRHLIHEVTSPQAFEGLRMQKRKVALTPLTSSAQRRISWGQSTSHTSGKIYQRRGRE